MFLTKYDLGNNLTYKKSSYTMTWYEDKTDLKHA